MPSRVEVWNSPDISLYAVYAKAESSSRVDFFSTSSATSGLAFETKKTTHRKKRRRVKALKLSDSGCFCLSRSLIAVSLFNAPSANGRKSLVFKLEAFSYVRGTYIKCPVLFNGDK